MKHLTLKAELRSEFGKKAAKAARREGFVPCNLYGAGENVTFVVNEKELLPLWYIATNKASGSLSYTLVDHGSNPAIPTAKMDNNYGAVIALDVIDRGYAGAFTDNTDGAVFCDADGSVLIIH